LINSIDSFVYNIENFLTDVQYFNIIFYDPLKIYGNIEAAYEYCTFNVYLDQIGLLAGLDWGYMGEVLVRDSIILATELGTALSDYNDYLADDD